MKNSDMRVEMENHSPIFVECGEHFHLLLTTAKGFRLAFVNSPAKLFIASFRESLHCGG